MINNQIKHIDIASQQRHALSDVLDLSHQCGQIHDAAYAAYQSELSALEQYAKEISWKVKQRYENMMSHSQAQVQSIQRGQLQLLNQQTQLERAKLQQQLQVLIARKEQLAAKIKLEKEEAFFVIESVLEAASVAASDSVAKAQDVLLHTREECKHAIQVGQEQAKRTPGWVASSIPTLPVYKVEDLPEDKPTVYDIHDDLSKQVSNMRKITGAGWTDPVLMGFISIFGIACVIGLLFILGRGEAPIVAELGDMQMQIFAALSGVVVFEAILLLSAFLSRRKKRFLMDALWDTLVRDAQRFEAMQITGVEFAKQMGKAKVTKATAQRDIDLAEYHHAAHNNVKNEESEINQALHKQQQLLQVLQKEYQIEFDELQAQIKTLQSQELFCAEQQAKVLAAVQVGIGKRKAIAKDTFDTVTKQLQEGLSAGQTRIQEVIETVENLQSPEALSFGANGWDNWTAPSKAPDVMRFGSLKLHEVGAEQGADPRYPIVLQNTSDGMSLPAWMPSRQGFLIEHDGQDLEKIDGFIRAYVARLLVSMPAGMVRLAMIDTIGLGDVLSPFMTLGDENDQWIGGRIWTESQHVERCINDLTEHMENVIQAHLRGAFDDIDSYNAQAGELAEPYRFLVITGFPAGFSQEILNKLQSIVTSGSRCGVFVFVAWDRRQGKIPVPLREALRKQGVWLQVAAGKTQWQDTVFGRYPLTLEQLSGGEELATILKAVKQSNKQASKVEVPFGAIAPITEELWSRSAADGLDIPVGRCGATRLQEFQLGKGTRQHALVAGETGSGKSSFLHTVVTNLCMWYGPDEAQVYLIDFKKGVEFKAYADLHVPHIQAVAIESDREFGLSVLQRLDEELTRRGDMFRKASVQNVADWREAMPDTPMPRILLVIDEFQEFFNEDDRIHQNAIQLLDRLVRQGRAFGIHLLLGSQTLGGAASMPRSTLGQMTVRVALQCSESDAALILSDDNTAARLLSRPGEAIYNDAGGKIEGNSLFQVAWLPDKVRQESLLRVGERVKQDGLQSTPPIVFEGGAAVHLKDCRLLAKWQDERPAPKGDGIAFVGEPVAIKDPTSIVFQRQSGSHLLVVSQNDDAAHGVMLGSVRALQLSAPSEASFYVFDGTLADAPQAKLWSSVAEDDAQINLVGWRDVEQQLATIKQIVESREDTSEMQPPPVYLCILRLQRYRMLEGGKGDGGSFSFSLDGPEETVGEHPGDALRYILKEGAQVGVHVMIWSETLQSFEHILERNTLRQFDHRVLFQMSASDATQLAESLEASRLGQYRGLYVSEEKGIKERFRPFSCEL